MKITRSLFISLALCLTSNIALAYGATQSGVQFSYRPGAGAAIGYAWYAPQYLYGISGGGTYNDAATGATKRLDIGIWAGMRKALSPNSIFAYGIDLGTSKGRTNGQVIQHSYSAGPFVEYEYTPSQNVMLSAWLDIYHYKNEKRANVVTRSHDYASKGGIAMAYFFS